MKLLTKEIKNKLPALYSQEGKGLDAMVIVKFFNPQGIGTWYATEACAMIKDGDEWVEKLLKDIKPEVVLDIGAGVGRASVWLFKKYEWKDTMFVFLDGDEGKKQYEGVRKNKGEYYNNWDIGIKFCKANNLTDVSYEAPEDIPLFKMFKNEFDLIYSFLAIGFHWKIDLYLNDLYPLCHKNTILIFGLRGTEKKSWVEGQIERIDPKKYKVLKFIHKPTQTRESVVVLCPVNL